ncbi:uncharacterized protein LOC144025909 [Festucalex cinctus]
MPDEASTPDATDHPTGRTCRRDPGARNGLEPGMEKLLSQCACSHAAESLQVCKINKATDTVAERVAATLEPGLIQVNRLTALWSSGRVSNFRHGGCGFNPKLSQAKCI